MSLLENQVAIVTGGTRGIGKGIVKSFLEEGAKVAFTYASSDALAQEMEAEFASLGTLKGYKSNASDFEAAQELVNQVSEDIGAINIVVNNAGVTKDNLLLRMSKDDWDKVIKINLDSIFNLTKAVSRPMMKIGGGSIINMSSVVGVKGNAGQANYAASKAGIIGFSKSVAIELGSRQIRCNVIAPGFIETEMTDALDEKVVQEWRDSIPLKRGGTPDDIANACVFLASDKSSYITGQVLHVNGGMYT